jgi:hypothetical protein
MHTPRCQRSRFFLVSEAKLRFWDRRKTLAQTPAGHVMGCACWLLAPAGTVHAPATYCLLMTAARPHTHPGAACGRAVKSHMCMHYVCM